MRTFSVRVLTTGLPSGPISVCLSDTARVAPLFNLRWLDDEPRLFEQLERLASGLAV